MGGSLRSWCAVPVRALLVPALLACAWLIWGAGTAQASSQSSITPASGLLDPGTSGDPAGSVSGIPSTSTATSKAVSADPSMPPKQGLPANLVPVTDTVAAVGGTPDALVGEAAAAVSTETKTAAPALSHIDNAVAAVDEAVATLEPRLPRLTPPVPVVQLPVPVVQLPVPVPVVQRFAPKPFPGQEARPALRPAPAAAAPDAGRPTAAVHPISAAKAPVASAAAPSTVRRAAPANTTANSPAAPAAAEIQEAGSRGQTLAQLHMTSISRPWARSAVQTDPLRVPHSLSGVDVVGLAATHGESGSSNSEGSGGQAADVAAFWNTLSQLAGERRLDAAIVLPPSPAFDPGSSPD
ncbi:hypothetical protein [Arthrobacter sp. NPDC093139]|uniref:hypothetical protein n=1 Tax=Arthrobacter sp. NPDC093139 TaxID=3363945 RepID=UPI0038110593